MQKGRSDLLIALIVVGVLIIFAIVALNQSSRPASSSGSSITSNNSVGLIEIIGVIYDSRSWVEKIDDFRKKDKIKAIVIRIDSPGGVVAASQELYEAIKRASEEKPVIASFGNVAASGGYYAALGADSIVANSGSTTGSIGVYMETLEYHELMDKVGVSSNIIKSGKFKDAGTPTRELSRDEKAYFQSYIDDSFKDFAEVVAKERNLTYSEVLKIADGRVFTGRQALQLGLVDRLGDQYISVRLAADMAGIKGEPNVVRPPKKGSDWLEIFLDEAVSRIISNLETQSVFHYRWKPETVR